MRYAIVKLLLSIPTLILVAGIIFLLMRAIPGDPALLLVGDSEDAAALEQARKELGLDKPYIVQFGLWFSNILSGDLGVSMMTGEPVLSAIGSRFMVTAQVVLIAVGLALLVAVPLGTYAAARQNQRGDLAVVLLANLLISVPSFWIGLLLILIFGATLGWLPTVGYVSIGENLTEGLRYLVLPVVALLCIEIATLVRMVRASTLDVLRQDYVMSARAKGLDESTLIRRHVVKNSFLPTMTLLGLILGSLLGGTAVIETVFTLPGLGRFLVDGIYARDYAVVQGVLIVVALIHVAVNLAVDLIYPFIDPRVRF
ncbi:ABC transporter permease [Sphingosinicella sp.]|uniref:ABC transporter permease n=1 Tax=Sphingosinicella sp. TaxID=1917971 RepID=UPI0035AE7835